MIPSHSKKNTWWEEKIYNGILFFYFLKSKNNKVHLCGNLFLDFRVCWHFLSACVWLMPTSRCKVAAPRTEWSFITGSALDNSSLQAAGSVDVRLLTWLPKHLTIISHGVGPGHVRVTEKGGGDPSQRRPLIHLLAPENSQSLPLAAAFINRPTCELKSPSHWLWFTRPPALRGCSMHVWRCHL